MNLFSPERGPNESRTEYSERRKQAKAAVRKMTCAGMDGGISSRQQLRDSRRQARRMAKQKA